MDQEQERLRTEIHIELQKKYIYKTGEPKILPEEGCSIEEAIVVLACNSGNLDYAILSKKEVEKLWEDITQPPYTQLFNKTLTNRKLWNLVELLRTVELIMKQKQSEQTGPARNIAVHGNRFILFKVLKELYHTWHDFGDPTLDIALVKEKTQEYASFFMKKPAMRKQGYIQTQLLEECSTIRRNGGIWMRKLSLLR